MSASIEVEIDRLGARGDGIAENVNGLRLFVDGALAGERVEVRLSGAARQNARQGELVRVLRPSPERTTPPCPHAGPCGGCRLQHLASPSYAVFLEHKVRAALRSRGLESIDISSAVLSPPHERRRLRLAWQRTVGGLLLGMRQAQSKRIVDWTICVVAKAALVVLLKPLRAVLGDLSVAAGEVALDLGPAGIDVVLMSSRPPSLDDRMSLAASVGQLAGVCRISWHLEGERSSEPVIMLAEPFVCHGPLQIALPPGAFRQATDTGETAIRGFANEQLATCGTIVDLFGGIGALSLGLNPLPHRICVVEGDLAAVSALRLAVGRQSKAGKVEAIRRDLEKDPLQPKELHGVDAAIIDPPRAGARSQCHSLATSDVQRVVYVSCDAGSFARDARILVDGGYRLQRVLPIGQFLWSDQVELAASFLRQSP